jgi:predicted glycoside hydrolase/deacetylase ChbG (UPF0249 family)
MTPSVRGWSSIPDSPVLIINADDLGASISATGPIVVAYDEGLIPSATAMVWMPGSERAARLARERGMPLGLHLNFTLPFRDQRAPASRCGSDCT